MIQRQRNSFSVRPFNVAVHRSRRAFRVVSIEVRDGKLSRYHGKSFLEFNKTGIVPLKKLSSTVEPIFIGPINLFWNEGCGLYLIQEKQSFDRQKSNIGLMQNLFLKASPTQTIRSPSRVTWDHTKSVNLLHKVEPLSHMLHLPR